jgi:hypothetical protein
VYGHIECLNAHSFNKCFFSIKKKNPFSAVHVYIAEQNRPKLLYTCNYQVTTGKQRGTLLRIHILRNHSACFLTFVAAAGDLNFNMSLGTINSQPPKCLYKTMLYCIFLYHKLFQDAINWILFYAYILLYNNPKKKKNDDSLGWTTAFNLQHTPNSLNRVYFASWWDKPCISQQARINLSIVTTGLSSQVWR